MITDSKIDNDTLSYVFSRNSMPPPIKIQLLSNSLQFTTLYVKTKNDRYITRIYDSNFSKTKASFLIEALTFAQNHSSTFCKIILHDYIDSRVIIVFAYYNGRTFVNWNHHQSYCLGSTLSRLHAKSVTFTPLNSNDRFLEQTLMIYSKIAFYIPENFKELHSEVSYFASKRYLLPKGIIHGDPYEKNILFARSGSVILLDNVLVNHDFLLFDISHVFAKYYFSKEQIDPLGCFKAFISGYEENRRITVDEKILMPEIVRLRLLFSIVYLFDISILISGTCDLFIDSCYMNYLKLLQVKHIEKIDL